MRREVTIVWILLLLTFVIAAPSVTLDHPGSTNTTNQTTIVFQCSASDGSYAISSIALYTNSSGTWTVSSTQSNASTTAYFSVSSLSTGNHEWNCLATNTNSETAWASSNSTVSVTNLAYTSTIAEINWTEDTTNGDVIDLDDYFSGATSYSASNTSYITVSIGSDNKVTFTPNANFSGSETLTFTASDGVFTAESGTVNLTVINVNDPPYLVDDIAKQTLVTNEEVTINLEGFFGDPDGNDTLNYTISASHFVMSEDGYKITITPQTDWEGKENVSITASDGTYSVESTSFVIEVNANGEDTDTSSSTNTAPEFYLTDPEDEGVTIELGDSISFGISVSDADDDELTISWYVDDSLQEGETEEAFTFSPEREGSYAILVIVSDGTDEISTSWTLVVGEEEESTILTDSEEETVCGNGIEEDGEDCSSCALDVSCSSGYLCNEGVCEEKKSATRAVGIFLIAVVAILILAILIYYFTTLKKGGPKQTAQAQFGVGGIRQAPPSDVSDFYTRR